MKVSCYIDPLAFAVDAAAAAALVALSIQCPTFSMSCLPGQYPDSVHALFINKSLRIKIVTMIVYTINRILK